MEERLDRQMEERHVSAFKPIECATVLDGSESEPGLEAKIGPVPTDADGPCEHPGHEKILGWMMTYPDDAPAQTLFFNRGHAQEVLRD